MADFEDHIEWGEEPETDKMIDSLFGPVSTKTKKSKKKKKQTLDASGTGLNSSKCEDNYHMEESIQSPERSNVHKDSKGKKKSLKFSQAELPSNSSKLQKTVVDEEKLDSSTGLDDNIPRKSRKNKYYSLAKSEQKQPGITGAEDGVIRQVKSEESVRKKKVANMKKSKVGNSVDSFHEQSKSDQNINKSPKIECDERDISSVNIVQEEKDLCGTDSVKVHKSTVKKNRKRKKSEQMGEISNHPIVKKSKISHSLNSKSKSMSPFNISKLRNVLQGGSTGVGRHMDEDSLPRSTETSDSGPSKKLKKRDQKPKTLKERMEEKLKSARFRHLNEQLYTTSGAEAYDLFQGDTKAFQVYHEGFQSQVTKWPDNPLDRAIKYIKNRPTNQIVADFGCGDARLAANVKHKVYSFDLVAINPRVTACDMSKIPLEASTIDVGVFCLSLMGTNLLDYLLEAHRIIKLGGILLVAEVVSRFENVSLFVRKLAKLGFILLKKDAKNKMFVWFEFKKAADFDPVLLPQIDLHPCIYKKR